MQTRELASNPRPGIVLIGNRVNAKLRDDCVEFLRRLGRFRVQQRLRQRVGPAPGQHP
jgi:hypothetical protein